MGRLFLLHALPHRAGQVHEAMSEGRGRSSESMPVPARGTGVGKEAKEEGGVRKERDW